MLLHARVLLVLVLGCVFTRALPARAAPPPTVLTLLWIEHGGNLESLGNERIIVRYDRSIVYERGRAEEKEDPRYGKVLVGACDRYTAQLSEAELAQLNALIVSENLASLEPLYNAPEIHDGTQAGLLLKLASGARPVTSSFSNAFPPGYRALLAHLRQKILPPLVARKPARCDPATWLFIRPAQTQR